MKILHLPSTFFPHHTGGKEVFVENLIRTTPEATHAVQVHDDSGPRQYVWQGIEVHVLPEPLTTAPAKSYYSLLFDSIPGFAELLDQFKPDIVHFHDFGGRASLSHLRICKIKNLRTLVTYHSPGQSCLQRALLLEGTQPCDGRIELTRCTRCRYRIRGVPPLAARVASHVSLPVDKKGRYVLRNSTKLFWNSWREFHRLTDMIQIHAHWVEDLLLLNDVPKEKIKFIQMGGTKSLPPTSTPKPPGDPLKLVFVGRCTDIKGIHLLIAAVGKLPLTPAVELHFFGPSWDDAYGKALRKEMQGDSRFKEPRLLHPDKVVEALSAMDVCVIPSLWPETGPLTLFDAFAAGLPVVGANHAGIAERVEHNKTGLLFEWGNADDLRMKLSELAGNPDKLLALKRNIPPTRTFAEMGRDFLTLYESL